MFSIDDFQKLKTHLPAGSVGLGFSLNAQVKIIISDNTSRGGGWEIRIHEEATHRMCILTESDAQLTADYRYLVPRPNGSYDFQPLSDREFEHRAQVLFADVVVFLERKRAEEIEATRRATDRLQTLGRDEAAMQRWRHLAQLLVSDPAGAEKIAKATGRAFTAPAGFVRRLRLPRVMDDIPWLALIAALRKDKLLVEFDWREDLDDVTAGVDALCAQSGHPPLDWAVVSGQDRTAGALLHAASRTLEVHGLMLVCLDTGGDSFPTALMPVTSFEAASSNAATFGWRINRFVTGAP